MEEDGQRIKGESLELTHSDGCLPASSAVRDSRVCFSSVMASKRESDDEQKTKESRGDQKKLKPGRIKIPSNCRPIFPSVLLICLSNLLEKFNWICITLMMTSIDPRGVRILVRPSPSPGGDRISLVPRSEKTLVTARTEFNSMESRYNSFQSGKCPRLFSSLSRCLMSLLSQFCSLFPPNPPVPLPPSLLSLNLSWLFSLFSV